MFKIGPNNEPKRCPKCGAPMRRHEGIYTSYPPQYGYTCPKCEEVAYDTNYYPNEDEVEKRKPVVASDVFDNYKESDDYFGGKVYSITRDEQIEMRKRQWNDLMKKSKEDLVRIIMGDPYDITPKF